jgi:uncharacterized protein DUF6588
MINKIFFKIIMIVLVLISLGFSQTDLETNLQQILNSATNSDDDYVRNYLKGYMQPFVTAFSSVVSGAMYHRATAKGFPRFDVGISAVYLALPDEALTFNDPDNNEVPTVFGLTSVHNTLTGGTGLNSLLIPQLQINLGLISSFEATARYMNFNVKEFGDIYLMGLGVKYGFGEFMPVFPIDLSVQAMYHKFAIGDWLNSGTIGMNLQLSKELLFLPVDFYGGIGFENTTMLIKTGMIPVDNILDLNDISIDGENNYRVNLGLSWTLAFFNLHADYNFGKYNSLSFGAMIVL